MILRLQSEEQLQELEKRIKTQCKSLVHESSFPPYITEKSVQTPSQTHQDHPGSISKPRRSPDNWERRLEAQLKFYGYPAPVLEYRFHPVRRWRFDLAWPERKIAVEINGGLWVKGRHSRGMGYFADMAKRNEANRMGWHIYEFSPSQVKKGEAVSYLMDLLL